MIFKEVKQERAELVSDAMKIYLVEKDEESYEIITLVSGRSLTTKVSLTRIGGGRFKVGSVGSFTKEDVKIEDLVTMSIYVQRLLAPIRGIDIRIDEMGFIHRLKEMVLATPGGEEE